MLNFVGWTNWHDLSARLIQSFSAAWEITFLIYHRSISRRTFLALLKNKQTSNIFFYHFLQNIREKGVVVSSVITCFSLNY